MKALLRNMDESDLDMVLTWRNAESVRKNMYTSHIISSQEHREWWKVQSVNSATRLLVCELASEPLGVVAFTHYTGKGGTATWAFYSGNTSRRGIGRMMELAALDYAFDVLELRRLECEVLSFNRTVIEFHRRYGFTLEGISKHACDRDGELHDIFRLAMHSHEWNKNIKKTVIDIDFRKNSLAGFKKKFNVEITSDLIEAYSSATNDQNPVHLDDAAARYLGFAGRIAHGMLFGGLFSRYFANEFPGPGTIYISQNLNFLVPVPVGSSATVILKVIAHIGRRLTIESIVKVGEEFCISGEAVLLVPKDFNVASVRGRE